MVSVLKVAHNIPDVPSPLVCADLDDVMNSLAVILGEDSEWEDQNALKVVITVAEMSQREYEQLVQDEWYG